MVRYRYDEINKRTGVGDRLVTPELDDESSEDYVRDMIYQEKLLSVCQERFDELFQDFTGDIAIVADVKAFLSVPFGIFADDLETLKMQMCSLYEIADTYQISDIEIASECYG